MSKTITNDQYDTFIVLLDSDIDRLRDIIEEETRELSEFMTQQDVDDMRVELSRLEKMRAQL